MSLSRPLWRGGLWDSQIYANGLWRGGLWNSQRIGDAIQSLFSSGRQGVWLEASPTYKGEQVLWQQNDGTVPVTADGNPVGRDDDLSPNGNNATQSVSADKPIYKTDGTLHWLRGDGVDDFIRADSGQETTQPVVHFFAFKMNVTGSTQNIFNGVSDSGGGGTNVQYLAEVSGSFQVSAGVALNVQAVDTNKHVMTIVFDGANSYVRVDGALVVSGDTGSNAWRGTTLFNNRLGTTPGAVDAYGYIVREGIPSLKDIENTESYLADLAGITL